MPTERPIAYTRDNILAILAGRKRMTRRIVKPQPPSVEAVRALAGTDYSWYRVPETTRTGTFRIAGPVWAVRQLMGSEPPDLVCPFGIAGDLLWVREGWRTERKFDEMNGTQLREHFRQPFIDCPIAYDAGGAFALESNPVKIPGRLRAARYMPRWASRIDQKLTKVSLEPLQKITEADARAEGVEAAVGSVVETHAHRVAFQSLWDSINGKRPDCDWDSNPFVWVLEVTAP